MRYSCLLATALMLAQGVSAAEFGGYAAVTTDYVKRGVSQSDGDPALQLGGEVSFANGIFLGAWGSTTDIYNGRGRQRDREVNYYFGYAMDVTNSWQVSGHAVAYKYPGQTGGINYNYLEYSERLVNRRRRGTLRYVESNRQRIPILATRCYRLIQLG
jgi:uncharacterized protein (TIGR02001 family)